MPNPLQTRTAIAQLRTKNAEQSAARARLTLYLQNQAEHLSSRVLNVVARHAEADHFVEVKKTIKGLITRLMGEASEESDLKVWLDEEFSTNEQVRKERTRTLRWSMHR